MWEKTQSCTKTSELRSEHSLPDLARVKPKSHKITYCFVLSLRLCTAFSPELKLNCSINSEICLLIQSTECCISTSTHFGIIAVCASFIMLSLLYSVSTQEGLNSVSLELTIIFTEIAVF